MLSLTSCRLIEAIAPAGPRAFASLFAITRALKAFAMPAARTQRRAGSGQES